MDYTNIPRELQEKRAWVNVWNTSKIPWRSTENAPASCSDESTWSDFACAVGAVRAGKYDGIGYVFQNDGLVGIDIDIGFTDGFLSETSVDIMRACRSYTEKSRSGRGVHILVKGCLPFDGKNNRAGVEIYQTGRYFICTGDVLVFSEIVENQAAIDYVLERYFRHVESAERMFSSTIYTGTYGKPSGRRIPLRPHYPPIGEGGRNISLASLGGQLRAAGYTKAEIFRELLRCNSTACDPPLPLREVRTITNSIARYSK